MQFVTGGAVALKAAQGVLTAVLTTTVIHATLVYVSAVGQSIQSVAFVANALKAPGRVDTRVVTGPFKEALVDIQTGALVRQQLEALAAAALVAADGVPAEVVTSTIVELTLINVFAGLAIRLQGEAVGAATMNSCGRVLAVAVTAPVIQRTRLHKQSPFDPFVHFR